MTRTCGLPATIASVRRAAACFAMEPRVGSHNAVHAGVLVYHFVAFVPYCAARISSSGGEATYVPLKFGGNRPAWNMV